MSEQNYIWGGELFEGAEFLREHALSLGLVVHDRLEMIGNVGPQPKKNPDGSPRRQSHARRNLSTLFVLRRMPVPRTPVDDAQATLAL